MKYPDDIDFFYILENHGWSTCYLSVDNELYHMGPTHIFENPIKVLLTGLIEIMSGAEETHFKWSDEPGEYHWNIVRNKKEKHKVFFEITECINRPICVRSVFFFAKSKLYG